MTRTAVLRNITRVCSNSKLRLCLTVFIAMLFACCVLCANLRNPKGVVVSKHLFSQIHATEIASGMHIDAVDYGMMIGWPCPAATIAQYDDTHFIEWEMQGVFLDFSVALAIVSLAGAISYVALNRASVALCTGSNGLRCRTCGYNLKGNISRICPECGAACKAADPAGESRATGD